MRPRPSRSAYETSGTTKAPASQEVQEPWEDQGAVLVTQLAKAILISQAGSTQAANKLEPSAPTCCYDGQMLFKVTASLERPRCLRRFKHEKRRFYRFCVQNVGFVAMGALEACFKRPRNTVAAAENQRDALFQANASFETLSPITSRSRSWC